MLGSQWLPTPVWKNCHLSLDITPDGGALLPGLLPPSDRRKDSRTVHTAISLFPTQLLVLALGVLLTSGTRAGGLGEALRALLQDTRQVIRTSDGMVRVLELDPFSPGGDPLLSVHFLMQTALGQLVRAVGSGASLPGFKWPCHLLAVAVHRPLKFSVPQFPHL